MDLSLSTSGGPGHSYGTTAGGPYPDDVSCIPAFASSAGETSLKRGTRLKVRHERMALLGGLACRGSGRSVGLSLSVRPYVYFFLLHTRDCLCVCSCSLGEELCEGGTAKLTLFSIVHRTGDVVHRIKLPSPRGDFKTVDDASRQPSAHQIPLSRKFQQETAETFLSTVCVVLFRC